MTNNNPTESCCGICANCVPQIDGGSGFNNCAEAHAAQMVEDKAAMNNNLTDEHGTKFDFQALREAAEKATKGEWWSDVVETDGEYGEGEDRVSGYHSYAVYVGHESLLDMTNSTAACIHTEWDHDYHMAWDETAKRNAEFVAAASPDTVLALLDENIQLQREKDAMEAVALVLRDDMRQAREKFEAAEKRIAELEARTLILPDAASVGGQGYREQIINQCRAAGISIKGSE